MFFVPCLLLIFVILLLNSKDVRLPVQLQRAMATEAEATREARAKVVAAQGEQNASVALKEAADTINKSPIALQLRYLQTLTHIAGEKNSTIVFPVPLEFLKLIGNESNLAANHLMSHSDSV
jgi:erythrocyte band 7 integral membrane protein